MPLLRWLPPAVLLRWLPPAVLTVILSTVAALALSGSDASPHSEAHPAPAVLHQAVPAGPRAAVMADPSSLTGAPAAPASGAAQRAASAAIQARKLAERRNARAGAIRRAQHAVAVRKARYAAAVRRIARATRTCRHRHGARICRARRAAALRRIRHAFAAADAHSAHNLAARGATQRAAARKAAARRAAARRAYQRATFRLPRRHPGYIARGHYLRSLGRPGELGRMWWLGARDAARNPGGMVHLVLLDIGGQAGRGVYLSVVNRFVGYPRLTRALDAYVAGYHAHQHRAAPATISLGTNNDLYTSARAGWLWATQVVNRVRRAARRYPDITIAGADDIEPGFRAGPRLTHDWLSAYLHSTGAPFVFNGSADGCSPTRALSRCAHGWSARMLTVLAGAAAPSRIIALPQIYNRTMAAQWAQIARTARRTRRTALRIVGPLTEQAACGRDPACPSMPSRTAWRLLHRQLDRVRPHAVALSVQVDLDVR